MSEQMQRDGTSMTRELTLEAATVSLVLMLLGGVMAFGPGGMLFAFGLWIMLTVIIDAIRGIP